MWDGGLEHCSSQPANKPQLRVTGSDPLGPFSCPDLYSDILTQPSLSLSTSSSVSPLKGVTRRYTHQLLTLLCYFSLKDGARIDLQYQRIWQSEPKMTWTVFEIESPISFIVTILYSILIWRMLQMEFTTPARPTETLRQLHALGPQRQRERWYWTSLI